MPADDLVTLENLTFYGYHGVNPEERQLGQRFVVSLALSCDLRAAGRSDDLRQTINYAEVFRLTRDIVEGPPVNLIETVAERIAAAILANTRATQVVVRIQKPGAPVKGLANGIVGIEIRRSAAE